MVDNIAKICFKFFKRQAQAEEIVLILCGFGAFLIAHSLFWYLGIFNSLGLKRVLIGIMPMMALIVLYGFNGISEYLFENRFNKFVFKTQYYYYSGEGEEKHRMIIL